jgi:hypothetical protein
VAYTFPSDGRFKIDVTENVPGLSFISKLRPVTYRLDMDRMAEIRRIPAKARSSESESKQAQIVKTGFIAQEVELAANEVDYDFDGVNKPEDETGYYGLAYSTFVVPLVQAVQEQQAIIDTLNTTAQQQQDLINTLIDNVKQQQDRINALSNPGV